MPPDAPTGPAPYVGLRPFSSADAGFFFGREHERRIIAANLTAARLTVLYGASGVGKSSVLDGGVVHDLLASARRRPDQPVRHAAAYFRDWSSWRHDPLAGISLAIREQLARQYGIELGGDGAPDFRGVLDAWMRTRHGGLLLILDQFEEYLLYREGETGDDDFTRELPRVVGDADLRVNVLIGIRDDALARLDRFKGRLPQLFDNRLELKRLTRSSATAAIEHPLAKLREQGVAPARIEDELTRAVLDQVAVGRMRLGSLGEGGVRDSTGFGPTDHPVEAPYLQLVMERLWTEEREAGSPILRRETFERLGWAQKIVQDHLDTRMAALSDPQQRVAARIFRYLVTPSGAKIALSPYDLAESARIPEGELGPVLEGLSKGDSRILRAVAPPPSEHQEQRFEIFHDALARAVLDWTVRWEKQADEIRVHDAETRVRHERLKKIRYRGAAAGFFVGMLVLLGVVIGNQRRALRESRARALAVEATETISDDPQGSLLMALGAARLTYGRRGTVVPEVEWALHRIFQSSSARVILEGHPASLNGLAVSPDGSRLAAGDDRGTITVWDGDAGSVIRTLSGHRGPVRRLAFSPDGAWLASAGADSTARVWAVEGDEAPTVLAGHTGAVEAVAFDPSGTRLLTGSYDSTARLWELPAGRLRTTLVGHEGPVGAVAFASFGDVAITGSFDQRARVWDVATGAPRCTFFGHTGEIYAVDVESAWFGMVASGGRDMEVALWDPATCVETRRLRGHTNSVFDLAMSALGDFVATSGADGTVRVWNRVSGEEVMSLLGHREAVFGVRFSPDGRRVYTSSWDSTLRIWDADQSGSEVEVLQPAQARSAMRAVAFSPRQPQLAAIDATGWALLVSSLDRPRLSYTRRMDAQPLTLAYSPDGTGIAVGSDAGVTVVSAATGDLQAQLIGATLAAVGSVTALAYTPGANRLALGGTAGGIALWRPGDSTAIPLGARASRVNSLAFDAGGARLISGTDDGATVAWTLDADSVVAVDTLASDPEWVTGVAVSPDDRWLATASADHLVRVFSWPGAEPLRQLAGGNNTVWSIAIAPDNRRLAAASFDGTARVWDAHSGRLLQRLRGHRGRVLGVAFSSDGRFLATSGDNGGVRVSIVDTEALLAHAWSRVNRAPTPEQCERLLGAECPPAVSDVVEGRRLAAAGDVAGAAARFARAGDRDRTFRVNPDSLARTLAVDGWVGRGLALLRQDRALEAMGEFRKAVENDPGRAQELVPEITGGIATLLQTGDTTVVGPALEVYQEATAWDSTFVPTAEVLNSVCWWGSLGGHADAVAAYCEAAVRANPDAGYIVESRGVNRALRGDRAGAIEDFRVFVRWTSVDEDRARRQRWIRILERGGDPITPAEIAALRRE